MFRCSGRKVIWFMAYGYGLPRIMGSEGFTEPNEPKSNGVYKGWSIGSKDFMQSSTRDSAKLRTIWE